jgi:UDP-N-acetylglucosamine 2-epimerase (non-hydrolysing)
MVKKRIMFVFGTRPEAIKLAPIIREAEKHRDVFKTIIVTTGQHREMLDQVLRIFDIKPDYELKVMEREQTVTSIVARTLRRLAAVVHKERPDMMIVQGDTSTTFAAGLSAFYNKIPVAHVEAGLRTRDKFRPYPEEMNRKLTSSLADIHFAPTAESASNLKSEGVPPASIYLTGNTVIDALFDAAKKKCSLAEAGLKLDGKRKIILLTAHRRESFGAPLKSILSAVARIAKKYPKEVTIIAPLHKNPIASGPARDALSDLPNVELMEPLEYLPFVHLMKESYLILTDSGGVQEEAPSFGKPVLVLREVTERPEGVRAGTVKVVGIKEERIFEETDRLINDINAYEKMAQTKNPYGDGRASERIVSALLRHFGMIDRRPDDFIPEAISKERAIA